MTRMRSRAVAARRVPDTFVRTPRLSVWNTRGRVYGFDIRLRERGTKSAFGVTPDPHSLVTFSVDREHRPFSIEFDYPVDAAEFLRTLRLFLAGVDWGRTSLRPPRLQPGVLDLLLRGFERAQPAMDRWRESIAPRRRRRLSA